MNEESSASQTEPHHALAGRYELTDSIAVGGMAEVWRATDKILQRQVAVKLLHPHLAGDDNTAERFRREAISAARLSHPNIVPTYDAGTDAGSAFIVLGLVKGPTLQEVISERQLTAREALTIARQVCDALAYAHRNGIIHRDIKPSNVLVVDPKPRVLVADFGIAKVVSEAPDEGLTLPGLVVGTLTYASPEQLQGKDVDSRTDIYSLGVLLHEMLCSHVNEDHPTVAATAENHAGIGGVHDCSDLSSELREIVSNATQTNPENRYQTCEEMNRAIDDAMLHSVALATAPTAAQSAFERHNSDSSTHLNNETAATQRSDNPVATQVNIAPVIHSPSSQIPITPPQGQAPAGAVGQQSHDNSIHEHNEHVWMKRVPIVLLVILLIVTAAFLGKHFASVSGSSKQTTTTVSESATFVSAHSFDPFGDKTENESMASSVIKTNGTEAWSTQTYASRKFGNLKSGVGLVLETGASQKLQKLAVTSKSTGWAASIYISDSSSPNLEGWGKPVDQQSGLGTQASFDMHNVSGKFILIWITDLGDSNKLTLSSMRATS